MNWSNLWIKLFNTTTLFGLDMGFWVSMFIVLMIVILMNIVFWSLKPKQKRNRNTIIVFIYKLVSILKIGALLFYI